MRLTQKFKGLLIAALLMVPFLLSAESNKWKIKDFKVNEKWSESSMTFEGVETGIPSDFTKTAVNIGTDYLTKEQEEAIENWFRHVAYYFESQGFREPRYESLSFDGKAYEVQVLPLSDGAYAKARNDCENTSKNTVIQVDPLRSFENGKLTTKAYQDMAHELFHTVQYAYPIFQKHCKQGHWLTEGTAEFVGIETARVLLKKTPYSPCQIGKRKYLKQLYVSDEIPIDSCGKRSYSTQSFWQFLGEYATRQKFIATEKFVPPDISYLHGFFEVYQILGSPKKEYKWLDTALRFGKAKSGGVASFGISLQTAFSRFAGTFTSYWKDDRRNLYPGGSNFSPEEQEQKWIESIYGKCAEADLNSSNNIELNLSIEPVAARCIKISFNFADKVDLTFYASGSNEQSIDLQPLTISTNGGKKAIRRRAQEQHPDRIGKLTIDAKPGKTQYFIVSNVAHNAEATSNISPTIKIVPEIITTSMAKPKKKKKSDEEDVDLVREFENSLQSQSWSGSARYRYRGECTRPFEARVCGPTTQINLQLIAETAKLLDEVDGSSNISLERTLSVLDAIVRRGADKIPTDISNAIKETSEQDGWKIDIQIPEIKPGFTGTIKNADIKVQKAYKPDGSANGYYRAIGPAWVGPCAGGYHPLSGKVTIDESSIHKIKGRFEANLVDNEYKFHKSCQAAKVSNDISGNFIITRIRWNTKRPEISSEAVLDETIEYTNELLPGLLTGPLGDFVKERARQKQKNRNKTVKNKKGANDTAVCKCNCDKEQEFCGTQSSSNPKCCSYCEPVFNICKGNINQNQTLSAEEQAIQEEELKVMRQRYKDYVDSHFPNQAMKNMMMKSFDSLNTVQEKRMMMMMAIPQ